MDFQQEDRISEVVSFLLYHTDAHGGIFDSDHLD